MLAGSVKFPNTFWDSNPEGKVWAETLQEYIESNKKENTKRENIILKYKK